MGLAVTSYMLILAWNEDYGQANNPPEQPAVAEPTYIETQPGALDTVPAATQQTAPTSGDAGDYVPSLETAGATSAVPVEEETKRKLITVTTDVLQLQIDPYGGDIVQAALPKFPTSLDTPDIPFLLVDPRNAYAVQSGLIGPNGSDKSGARPTYSVPSFSFDMGDADTLTVPLRFEQEDGSVIVKKYEFNRGDYLIRVAFEVTNNAATNWQGGLFAQFKRDSQDPLSVTNNVMGMQPYVGGATRSESELYSKIEFDDLEDESFKLSIADGYMAMVQHYFVSAFVPTQDTPINYTARKLSGRDVFLFGFTTGASTIPPGQTGVLDANLYIGPKDQYRLEEIATGLDLTVDYGFLWWLAQPLFYLLTAIHGVFPNWGVAIICLTIIVKSLLYPLSAASFRSMAKMRKLQPEMVRLKERHGEDRQAFSQAMMELYKKEGANPLGGCFPILLQMPVFLALYWTLLESVELRQAPFALWIDDLSAMDPYFVLPILMGISMYLTQLMQPEPPDPVQAKVFKFMPIMFTFFFLWFPSGLVLYWLVNNILSILQQYYVTRQIEKGN